VEPKTFKEFLTSSPIPSDPKIQVFATRIQDHGEVQVRMTSGQTHSIHMGDKGTVEPGAINYVDREGTRHNLFVDQIEAIWTHKGYPEG
jgi:hypothetical protein